jgi:hypothetical protein
MHDWCYLFLLVVVTCVPLYSQERARRRQSTLDRLFCCDKICIFYYKKQQQKLYNKAASETVFCLLVFFYKLLLVCCTVISMAGIYKINRHAPSFQSRAVVLLYNSCCCLFLTIGSL